MWMMVGDVALRAVVWLSLPLYLFPHAGSGDASDRRLGHGRTRHWRAWTRRRSALRHCLDGGLHRRCRRCAPHRAPFGSVPAHALDPVHAGRRTASACSPSPAGRSISSRPMPTSAARAKARACCCQEYEQRGVGWLWQIDAENRVTYISSRMSALARHAGKPADRPLAAGAARRTGRARPGPARQAGVQRARDGAEDSRAARAGSRSPATRSSTPPAASRASAASAPTSPRSARPRNG